MVGSFQVGKHTAGHSRSFASRLHSVKPSDVKTWVWLAYDQLHEMFLDTVTSNDVGVVLIESAQKGTSRPYHKQKLAMLLSNQRHFALELQANGTPVHYVFSQSGYAEVLENVSQRFGPLECFEPAERSLRLEIEGLNKTGQLIVHPHPGWLTKRDWFEQSVGTSPPFRMDAFYRKVRSMTGWLMEEGKPVGGKYSYDAENRFPWKEEHQPPPTPLYSIDDIDGEVTALVESLYSTHPGTVDLSRAPTSAEDIEEALHFALKCLPYFGRYEDAMSEKSVGLFHTRLAPLVNLHRLLPLRVVEAVLASNAPLNSVEGYVRQMIWREYVHHVHDVTDGFRTLDVPRTPANRSARWEPSENHLDDGHPNFLEQKGALPQAYWGEQSGLRCLDASVQPVMDEGWTHHIPRLMVLSNIANLLDVNPRELTDWFHAAFIDAYDWVVEPNVLGMGTFALGTAMMTKPYVAGSAYINRMSDHCKSCSFHPKKNCPITRLYWAYLARHESAFEGNHRMSMALRNVQRRDLHERSVDILTFEHVKQTLQAGKRLHPEGLEDILQWTS